MISILAKKLLQDITKRGSARVSSLSLVPRSENMAAAIRRVNSMQYDVYTLSLIHIFIADGTLMLSKRFFEEYRHFDFNIVAACGGALTALAGMLTEN